MLTTQRLKELELEHCGDAELLECIRTMLDIYEQFEGTIEEGARCRSRERDQREARQREALKTEFSCLEEEPPAVRVVKLG